MNDRLYKKEQGATENRALRILGIGGYGAYFGWFLLTAFDMLPRYPNPPFTHAELLPPVMLFVGMAGATIALRIFANHLVNIHLSKWAASISTSVGAALSAFVGTSWLIGFPQPILASILSFVAGIPAIYFFFAWDNFGGRSKSGAYVRYLAASICIGDIIFLFTILLMDIEARCFFSLGLIIISGVLIATVNDLSTPSLQIAKEAAPPVDTDTEEHGTATLDKRIRTLFFIFGIAFGVAWVLFVENHLNLIAAPFVIAAILTAALILVTKKDSVIHDSYVTILIRSCIVVLGVSFLLLAFSTDLLTPLLLSIICATWQLFWIVDASLLMRHASKHNLSVPSIVLRTFTNRQHDRSSRSDTSR